jgi:hypothetical protein
MPMLVPLNFTLPSLIKDAHEQLKLKKLIDPPIVRFAYWRA